MGKKWKHWVAAGAALVALGVALWPSNDEDLETKVEEPIKERRFDRAEIRKRLLEVNKRIKQQEEEIVEEDLDGLSCLHCGNLKRKIEMEWYDKEKTIKKSATPYICEERHGWRYEWYKNGVLKYAGKYFCGKLNGRRTEWWNNGDVHIETDFVNDKFHGQQISYYPGGQKSHEVNYINNKKEGKEKYWHRNNQLYIENNFINGREEGWQMAWYKYGQIRMERYVENDWTMLCLKYNKEGNLIERWEDHWDYQVKIEYDNWGGVTEEKKGEGVLLVYGYEYNY